jgi:hypothetical protein
MRWASESLVLAVGVVAAVGVFGRNARGEGAGATYGRLAGDLTLVGAAGGVVASGGPRIEGELRVRYLESAGLFAVYEDGSFAGSSADPQRVLAAGLELRPLFLARWLKGHETEQPLLDLTVDSIGLELGATVLQPARASFGTRSGLQVGVGVELPLGGQADGPWIGLHGGVRWSDEALASGRVNGASDREGYLALSIAWHQVVATHIVDVSDRLPP